ncbi:MAG: polymorphic toxin type 44 domain-containing protein [Bryobacteraceae bacterium]
MDQNIATATAYAKALHDRAEMALDSDRSLAHTAASFLTLRWFYNKVKAGGDWDYKRGYEGDTTGHGLAEAYGNFNFGATAAALGIPYYIGQNGAGLAQIDDNLTLGKVLRMVKSLFGVDMPEDSTFAGIPFLKWPFGDQREDAEQIMDGYAFYESLKAGTCK